MEHSYKSYFKGFDHPVWVISGLAPVGCLPLRVAHVLLVLFMLGNIVPEHFECYGVSPGFSENPLKNVDFFILF